MQDGVKHFHSFLFKTSCRLIHSALNWMAWEMFDAFDEVADELMCMDWMPQWRPTEALGDDSSEALEICDANGPDGHATPMDQTDPWRPGTADHRLKLLFFEDNFYRSVPVCWRWFNQLESKNCPSRSIPERVSNSAMNRDETVLKLSWVMIQNLFHF